MKRFWILLTLVSLLSACIPSVQTPSVQIGTDTPTTIASPTLTAVPLGTETAARVEIIPWMPSSPLPPETMSVLEELQNLPVGEFFEQSYRQLIRREPELITTLGLAADYELRNDRLNDRSDAFLKETQGLERGILDLLLTYDRASLSETDQLTYDVYRWYLENKVEGQAFAYHNYPISHFIYSYHQELRFFFTDIFPLREVQDAYDYVACLSQIDEQVDQVIEGLEIRQDLGIIPPVYILEMADRQITAMIDYRGSQARILPTSMDEYKHLNQALMEMEILDQNTKDEILHAAETEITNAYLPAFIKLLSFVREQKEIASEDAGVWKLPDGEAYYAYRLKTETTLEITPEEIHQLGLAEVDRIQGEMLVIFSSLGIDSALPFDKQLSLAINQGGYYRTQSEADIELFVGEIEGLLDGMKEIMKPYFSHFPQAELVIIPDVYGGYYMPAARDGSRPGGYYITTGYSTIPKYAQPTTAYHEAIPGHYYQISLAQELDLPLLRNEISFNGYVEGWALYAENLAKEMGAYENDPYGDLGRLQLELLRAVRLVVDSGIHAMGWTREEAQDYIDSETGIPGQFTAEADRYIVLPAQAVSYKIGMLKFLALRQQVMDEMGEAFDEREFHDLVLSNGTLPLAILETSVEKYLQQKNP